jgi:hypothetical protein
MCSIFIYGTWIKFSFANFLQALSNLCTCYFRIVVSSSFIKVLYAHVDILGTHCWKIQKWLTFMGIEKLVNNNPTIMPYIGRSCMVHINIDFILNCPMPLNWTVSRTLMSPSHDIFNSSTYGSINMSNCSHVKVVGPGMIKDIFMKCLLVVNQGKML